MKTTLIILASTLTLSLTGCGGDDDAPAGSAGIGGSSASGGTGGSAGSGGTGGTGGGSASAIEIEGSWQSSFDSSEIIDDDSWSVDYGSGPSVSAIAQFSNEENVAITQNPDDADFDPSLYNRIVWTEIDGESFYYCTTDFGLDTEEEAAGLDTVPDASDPDNSGCSGFSWTQLTRQ